MGRVLAAVCAACVWLVGCSGDDGGGRSGGAGGAGAGNGGTTSGGAGSGGTSGAGGSSIRTESCGSWLPVAETSVSITSLSTSQDSLFVAGSYDGVVDLGVGSGGGQTATSTTGFVIALAQTDLTPKWRFELFDSALTSRIFSVAALPDGDVLVVGGQREEAVAASLTLARLSGADGSEVWRKTFNVPYGNAFVPVFVRQLGSSAYLFAKLTKIEELSLPPSNDPWIAQLDADGAFGWAVSLPKPDVGLDRMELVPTPVGDLALLLSADDGTGFQRRTSSITGVSAADGGVSWTTTLDYVDLRRALPFGGNIVVSAELDGSSVDLGGGNQSSVNGCPLIAYAPSSGTYVWHADVPTLSRVALDSDLEMLAAEGDFAYACSQGLVCGRYDRGGNVEAFPLFEHLPRNSLTGGLQMVSGTPKRLFAALTFRDAGRGVTCVSLP